MQVPAISSGRAGTYGGRAGEGNIAVDETQDHGQRALETWTQGEREASAEHLSRTVAGLACAGGLKKETCEEDLRAYLSTPVVNIFACMNSVIDEVVSYWSESRGAAVKETLEA